MLRAITYVFLCGCYIGDVRGRALGGLEGADECLDQIPSRTRRDH
jgi:hypothetical protein